MPLILNRHGYHSALHVVLDDGLYPDAEHSRIRWEGCDGTVIDGLGPDGISARVVDVTNRVVRLQTGYLYHYAFAMLIGVAALVTWMMLGSAQ